VRIHKSYIVSIGKIDQYKNDALQLGGYTLPVGRLYKQKFMEMLPAQKKY